MPPPPPRTIHVCLRGELGADVRHLLLDALLLLVRVRAVAQVGDEDGEAASLMTAIEIIHGRRYVV